MTMHAAFDRWWNGISLRAKITGVTVLLLTFGLTVAGAGTMTVLRTYLLEQTDQQIAAAYDKLQTQGAIDLATIRDYGDGQRLNPYYLAAISATVNPKVRSRTVTPVILARSDIPFHHLSKEACIDTGASRVDQMDWAEAGAPVRPWRP